MKAELCSPVSGRTIVLKNVYPHRVREVLAVMKAMLYLDNPDEPAVVLDDVQFVEVNQANHQENSHYRIFYKTKRFNATKKMVELHRDRKMLLKLDDGRTGNVLLTHASMDAEGNAVGVLRVLGEIASVA